MPVQSCQKDNKKGYKFGSSGKCYTGDKSKTKAKQQGRAIKASKQGRKK